MITIAEAATDRPCPDYTFFVTVAGTPIFLCSRAVGTKIDAAEYDRVHAGELSGTFRELVHTGNPWDDVTIVGKSCSLLLTGVQEVQSGKEC